MQLFPNYLSYLYRFVLVIMKSLKRSICMAEHALNMRMISSLL